MKFGRRLSQEFSNFGTLFLQCELDANPDSSIPQKKSAAVIFDANIKKYRGVWHFDSFF